MTAAGAPHFPLPDTQPGLVARAQAGCPDAFGALFERYRTPIFSYLYRQCGDRHRAEDFTQDTFIKAMRGIAATADGLNVAPWLYRIAQRVFLDSARHERLVQWHPWDAYTADFHPSQVDGETPETGIALSEEAETVRAILAEMRGRRKAALVLQHFHHLSVDQIAARMGTSNGAVRSLLAQGREDFARRWNERAGPDAARRRGGSGRGRSGPVRSTWGINVDRRKKVNPWRASPWDNRIKGNRWLGCFPTEEAARAAVDAWRQREGL